jgi:hypothetical protein
MTLKHAQAEARKHGMSIRKTSAGDYRVNFKNGPEVDAVYEATVKDALDTAKYMYINKYKYKYGSGRLI